MGQEFVIKSQQIEDKVNQLLPSQGGFQAGVDFSASTTIIPIVDLTETAEGSTLRQDLQTSLSLTSCTAFNVSNTTSTIVNTTGYYRIFGALSIEAFSGQSLATFQLTDGTTTKIIYQGTIDATGGVVENTVVNFDFNVFLEAGETLLATTNDTKTILAGASRQIADISGNLVNP